MNTLSAILILALPASVAAYRPAVVILFILWLPQTGWALTVRCSTVARRADKRSWCDYRRHMVAACRDLIVPAFAARWQLTLFSTPGTAVIGHYLLGI